MTLTEFVDEKLSIALDFRGLSPLNPVEIVQEYGGKKYIILVSHLEPDTLTVPYNVSWINSNPDSEDYKVLMRRVDAKDYDDRGYRGAWAVLSTVEAIYEETQYYKKESDPILGEVEQFLPPLSSKERLGGFKITPAQDDVLNPVAVGDNDPRMSDDREALPHSHPQRPASMLYAGIPAPAPAPGEEPEMPKFVGTTTNDPVYGDVLFVTEVLPDGNFVGTWMKPNVEFPYDGPLPVSIEVTGPVLPVPGGSNHVLRADVLMDDSAIIPSVKATWTIIEHNEAATINAATGVFKAGLVRVDTPVKVHVEWTHDGSKVKVSNDFIITIIGDPSIVELTSIAISGPDQFLKTQTGTYPVTATFSDGSTQVVTPSVYQSSNAAAATFSGGVLTPHANQRGDVSTRLTATYTYAGITKQATKDVTIKDPDKYPAVVDITGPVEVDQGQAVQLLAHVTFTDGSEEDVTDAVWSLTSTVFATIDASTGMLTAKPVTAPGDKVVTVNVSYTKNTVTKTAQKEIAVIDTKNWPVSATVTGPSTLEPSANGTYVYTVTYKDASTVVKTPTWSTSNEALATIAPNGDVTAGATEGNFTVRAVYTEDGVNLNANKAVTIALTPVVSPKMRVGVAMMNNTNFTGGPIPGSLTPEQEELGANYNTALYGTAFTHWTDFSDFVSKVMTTQLDGVNDQTDVLFTQNILKDTYLFIMWPKSEGRIKAIDQANQFEVTFQGICLPHDAYGNEDGLPGYDPNLPLIMTIPYDDGSGLTDWYIQRSEAPTENPRTDSFKIRYVPEVP